MLVDLGCGAGLLAPHVAGKGYRHVGVDLVASALEQAREHGVRAVRGDAPALPLADGCADVVVAGEILEHVTDLPGTVAEACRVLRPGGLLVLDTLDATALCRLIAVHRRRADAAACPAASTIPACSSTPDVLARLCARHGVRAARCAAVRPAAAAGCCAGWSAPARPGAGPIVPTRSTAVLYQGRGAQAGRQAAGYGRREAASW